MTIKNIYICLKSHSIHLVGLRVGQNFGRGLPRLSPSPKKRIIKTFKPQKAQFYYNKILIYFFKYRTISSDCLMENRGKVLQFLQCYGLLPCLYPTL